MIKYLLKRLLMLIPTLFGITLLSFVIINLAPGGPIEQKIRQLQFGSDGADSGGAGSANSNSNEYGISDEVLEALKKQYGFDKPMHIRYVKWLKSVVTLDFGNSFSYEEPVLKVIASKFPVSLQFGIISLLLTYLICIPLGVLKAVRDGSRFDVISSGILFVMYSILPLMLAILLIVFFAGGSYFQWFPVGELYSDNYQNLSSIGKIFDRIHHFVLPLACYMIGSFTVLTFLMKNSLLDVIRMDYIRTARSKGLEEREVTFKHALRNALIPIVTGIGGFISVFFAGSVIIEQIFSLDGMGKLGFKAAIDRDYNLLMGLIFLQSLLMLMGRLISDVLYMVVDPRIDFT